MHPRLSEARGLLDEAAHAWAPEAAAARCGDRTPLVNHPILGAFSVHDWRRFHRVHTRHHARQIHARR